jgi:uncharacterized membrane protein
MSGYAKIKGDIRIYVIRKSESIFEITCCFSIQFSIYKMFIWIILTTKECKRVGLREIYKNKFIITSHNKLYYNNIRGKTQAFKGMWKLLTGRDLSKIKVRIVQ